MIKTLTAQLIEISSGLLHTFPEVSDNTGHYQMSDDGGVEHNVGTFLYGLVSVLQPEQCLTTGIYSGVSDLYIAQALKDNGHGHSTALEIENTHLVRAERLWKVCGVREQITPILTPSLDFQPQGDYEFMFLDSEPQIRFAELVRFYPHLKPGGYVLIHDLPRTLCQGNVNPDHPEMKSYPYGDLPEVVKAWLKMDKLRLISFPTPRGLSGFYKPQEDDFHA